MTIDNEVRRIIREELPEALRALLGSASDRRDVPRLSAGKAPRVRKGRPLKAKRNDGTCHVVGCKNLAVRALGMFCAAEHGKLTKGNKAKMNAEWKASHAAK